MDLREALETAFKNEPAEQPEAAVDQAPDTAQPSGQPEDGAPVIEKSPVERARDDAGRFTKALEEAPVAAAPTAPEIPARKAPSSWKSEAQAVWGKHERGEALTAAEIKVLVSEAERRESDFHKGTQEFKSHADRARAYDRVISPHQRTFEQLGIDAPTAISKLLEADSKLRFGDPATKHQYFAQLAQSYGVDIGQLQSPPQLDPQTQYLMRQLETLQQSQQAWQNNVQQQQQAQAQQELQEFAADHPHFEAVRNEMATLLESGSAKSMKEAYETAVWMNPDIRKTLIEQSEAQAQRKALEAAQQKRAQTAAISIKGSSPAAGGGVPVNGSIRDHLVAAMSNH